VSTFQVGDVVRLVREVDLFPTIIAPTGATGVVSLVCDEDSFMVRMDDHFPQLDHWDNRLAVVAEDLEHATPKRGVWSVAIYHEEMAWGGPEEGGWWFDAGELLERPVRYFRTEEAAYAYARRLVRHLDRVNGKRRYEYSSVLSDGRYTAMVNDGHPLPAFPMTRPHYE
jgi:hypothetical protein